MIKRAVFHFSVNIGDIDTGNADGENDEAPTSQMDMMTDAHPVTATPVASAQMT